MSIEEEMKHDGVASLAQLFMPKERRHQDDNTVLK